MSAAEREGRIAALGLGPSLDAEAGRLGLPQERQAVGMHVQRRHTHRSGALGGVRLEEVT